MISPPRSLPRDCGRGTLPAAHGKAKSTLAVTVVAVSLLVVGCGGDRDGAGERWLATWGMAPHARNSPLTIEDTTVRQELQVSIGGERVRVRLSNRFGSEPLRIDAATIAVAIEGRSAGDSEVDPATIQAIAFAGGRGVAIPAGGDVRSDPIELAPLALQTLSVSLYFSAEATLADTHGTALRESFFAAGDQRGATELSGVTRRGEWFVLVGVEVEAEEAHEVVVALGDSITDGFGARQVGGSWPERLAVRLDGRTAVVNGGISGNRILRTGSAGFGPSALTRFDEDVLAPAGATTLVILEGINDIQAPAVPPVFGDNPPSPRVASADVIAGLRELAERGRAAGLRVIGGTLLPYSSLPVLIRDGETIRSEVNEWIRSSDLFDAIIDFEAAVADPDMPTAMLPAFDSGDSLHPSDAGYRAMAEAALAVVE